MTTFINQLQDRLDMELQTVETGEKNLLQIVSRSIPVAEKALNELRDYIRKNSFENTADEIRFYKEVEPRFHARLIYYVRLYQAETSKPVGGKEMLEAFYKEELLHQLFCSVNIDIEIVRICQ